MPDHPTEDIPVKPQLWALAGVLVAQDMALSNLINCAKDSPEVGKALLECYL